MNNLLRILYVVLFLGTLLCAITISLPIHRFNPTENLYDSEIYVQRCDICGLFREVTNLNAYLTEKSQFSFTLPSKD